MTKIKLLITAIKNSFLITSKLFKQNIEVHKKMELFCFQNRITKEESRIAKEISLTTPQSYKDVLCCVIKRKQEPK